MENVLVPNKTNWLKEKLPYFIVGLLGAIIFCIIYGIKILNPTYVDWLLQEGSDLTQHYLGWVGYRNGDWQFPIGMTNQLAYPESSSVIFTDSIPLFAVFFKLFEFILPVNFQYFGLWGIMSFILMGIFSYKVLSRFITYKPVAIISSIFFIISPTVIQRMYGQTALGGQWVLLIAFDYFFENKEFQNDKGMYIRWAILGMIVAVIHIYFLLICGIILVGSCVGELVRTHKIKKCIFMVLAYCIPAAVVVYLLGGFSSGMSADNGGLGQLSFNLNGLFNSHGWSMILKELPHGAWQGEGFAYLGFGILVMVVLSAFSVLVSKSLRKIINHNKSVLIGVLAMWLIALIFSTSNVITFNDKTLLTIPLPSFVVRIWSIFRATGRVAWILVYLTMLCACIGGYYLLKEHRILLCCVFSILICVQVYDLSGQLKAKHSIFSSNVIYQTTMKDDSFWEDNIIANGYNHVVFGTPFETLHTEEKWSLANWALSHGMTLSDYYFARDNTEIRTQNFTSSYEADDNTSLFIFGIPSYAAADYDLYYYYVDGLIVGTKEKIEGRESLSREELLTSSVELDDVLTIMNGNIEGNERTIYPEGVSFGPYWSITAGTYRIQVVGENLTDCEISAGSYTKNISEKCTTVNDDQQVEFVVSFDENIDDFEISIQNIGQENVKITQILVTYLN